MPASLPWQGHGPTETGQLYQYSGHSDRANATELEGEVESGKEEPVWY
jgi:hypothetical protein